jgi:hypothetical protein
MFITWHEFRSLILVEIVFLMHATFLMVLVQKSVIPIVRLKSKKKFFFESPCRSN